MYKISYEASYTTGSFGEEVLERHTPTRILVIHACIIIIVLLCNSHVISFNLILIDLFFALWVWEKKLFLNQTF